MVDNHSPVKDPANHRIRPPRDQVGKRCPRSSWKRSCRVRIESGGMREEEKIAPTRTYTMNNPQPANSKPGVKFTLPIQDHFSRIGKVLPLNQRNNPGFPMSTNKYPYSILQRPSSSFPTPRRTCNWLCPLFDCPARLSLQEQPLVLLSDHRFPKRRQRRRVVNIRDF